LGLLLAKGKEKERVHAVPLKKGRAAEFPY